jgi:hypothetical protein
MDGVESENALGAKRRQKKRKMKFTGRDGDKFINEWRFSTTKKG